MKLILWIAEGIVVTFWLVIAGIEYAVVMTIDWFLSLFDR